MDKKRCQGKLFMKGHDIGCPLKTSCALMDSTEGEMLYEPYSIRDRSCEHYIDKRGKKPCKKIRIEGKETYECVLAPNNIIISCIPHNDFLYLKPIKEVFDKFKDFVVFTDLKEKVAYPAILPEDKYEKITKTEAFKRLEQKFDLTI